ncbi:MAG TPA: aspartyl protease family protein [Pyrinomonadaceae bacterium]|jgi:predicted aspartyl protease|nr:aspartyl protease family protein [Pyrinomonadaceae bacterium]
MTLYALGGQAVRASEAVRFRLVRDHFVVVSVRLNGEGPFDFMLDTGTNSTIIDLALHGQLALPTSDRISLMTLAGSRTVPRAWLRRVALGAKAVENLEILCGDLRDIRSLDARIRGVLGQNFLSQFNYILNYAERRIEFEEDGDEMGRTLRGARLPFEDDEGKIIVRPEPASPKERALRLVLDSGISSLLLFSASSGRLGYDLDFSESLPLKASTNFGSSSGMRTGRIRKIRIGGETFRDLPLVLADGDAIRESRTDDGLLPTRLFRAIYFDHKAKMLILNPRPPG